MYHCIQFQAGKCYLTTLTLGFNSAVAGDAAMCVQEQRRRIRLWVQRWAKQFDVGRGKLQFLEEVPPG